MPYNVTVKWTVNNCNSVKL